MGHFLQVRREIIYETNKGYKKLSKKEKIERFLNLIAIIRYNCDYICGYQKYGRCVYGKDISGKLYRLIAEGRKRKKPSPIEREGKYIVSR